MAIRPKSLMRHYVEVLLAAAILCAPFLSYALTMWITALTLGLGLFVGTALISCLILWVLLFPAFMANQLDRPLIGIVISVLLILAAILGPGLITDNLLKKYGTVPTFVPAQQVKGVGSVELQYIGDRWSGLKYVVCDETCFRVLGSGDIQWLRIAYPKGETHRVNMVGGQPLAVDDDGARADILVRQHSLIRPKRGTQVPPFWYGLDRVKGIKIIDQRQGDKVILEKTEHTYEGAHRLSFISPSLSENSPRFELRRARVPVGHAPASDPWQDVSAIGVGVSSREKSYDLAWQFERAVGRYQIKRLLSGLDGGPKQDYSHIRTGMIYSFVRYAAGIGNARTPKASAADIDLAIRFVSASSLDFDGLMVAMVDRHRDTPEGLVDFLPLLLAKIEPAREVIALMNGLAPEQVSNFKQALDTRGGFLPLYKSAPPEVRKAILRELKLTRVADKISAFE